MFGTNNLPTSASLPWDWQEPKETCAFVLQPVHLGMSTKYKFNNPEGIYFVSFAVVGCIDVFKGRFTEIYFKKA
ncbi:hypothetical protein EIM50_22805 [Pseudoxanthomonas sp. SGD-10]|nr:hypothetical protein EIM50_22805 [Pseudoxanthomonas sp. SGD-10]